MASFPPFFAKVCDCEPPALGGLVGVQPAPRLCFANASNTAGSDKFDVMRAPIVDPSTAGPENSIVTPGADSKLGRYSDVFTTARVVVLQVRTSPLPSPQAKKL